MKKDTLDTKLEKILAKYGLSFAPTEKQYGIFMEEAVAQLKSLIKSTLLDALPKEKELLSFDGSMSIDEWYGQLKLQTLNVGYNTALKDIKDSLEGI